MLEVALESLSKAHQNSGVAVTLLVMGQCEQGDCVRV